MKQNINSHLTAKERDALSFPARYLQQRGLLVGEVLDFGCGLGSDVRFLAAAGVAIQGYDPHYSPIYPEGRFDTIICFYVLNVLQAEAQTAVIMAISRLLKPSGKAYFAVRRDIQYEGFRRHKIHQVETYQCLVRLNFKSLFKNESCEIYEYQHYNQLPKVASDCRYCAVGSEQALIVETVTTYALWDRSVAGEVRALVIPKRHVANYFELSFKEQSACWFTVNTVKSILTAELGVQDFNIGVDVGVLAGQVDEHVFIYVVGKGVNI